MYVFVYCPLDVYLVPSGKVQHGRAPLLALPSVTSHVELALEVRAGAALAPSLEPEVDCPLLEDELEVGGELEVEVEVEAAGEEEVRACTCRAAMANSPRACNSRRNRVRAAAKTAIEREL
jgi:hypothetical protein